MGLDDFIILRLAARLRDTVSKLTGLGYSESFARERLGLEDLTDLQWRHVPTYRSQSLAGRDPLALAIDLVVLQRTLPAEELDRLFVASEREVLIRAGLLEIGETGLATARASLFPDGDQLIFSDHAWPELTYRGYAAVPYDQVMGVRLDSRHLARCTTRRPFRTALDLCTGSGIHALLASTHTERVLAIDISPRAARCTRFNAQVSGTTNLKVVVGDLFEAVRGERFDLITANSARPGNVLMNHHLPIAPRARRWTQLFSRSACPVARFTADPQS